MSPTDLVVNADDFGWAVAVNRGILAAHRCGIVTSTSLLANGEAFDDAVIRAAGAPELGVGVHLNLLRGRALCPPHRLPHLVDDAGRFRRGPTALMAAVWLRRIPLLEIETELVAQVERVRAAGIVPTHLDSEKNLHGLPGLSAVTLRLADRFGIATVRRVTYERPRLADLGYPSFYKMMGLCAATRLGLGRQISERNGNLAGQTVGMSLAGHLNTEALCSLLRNLPPGPCELMVHPGYVDDASRRATRRYGGRTYIDRHREAELHALTDPRVLATCRRAGLRLVHFGGPR